MSDNMSEEKRKNNKILMYMHAGSGNHGCEAIVRSLSDIFDGEKTLLSHRAAEDLQYGLDEVCRVVPTRHVEERFVPHAWFYFLKKVLHRGEPRMAYSYKDAGRFEDYDVAVSIGGDNYCYEDTIYDLRMANSMFSKKGIRTALVGCSIEPELMKRPEIVEDMSKYSVIAARESITYSALRDTVYESTRIELIPDPAFSMKPLECELPEGFEPGKTIGINVSPMILGYERDDAPGITLNNYRRLIEKIIENTDDKIALIPHVVTPASDDRKPLTKLCEEYKDSGRVILVEDHSARELKYIISNCRLLIAARTHATIAAYSTCVPTLVVGYSVKSRGIAIDLFGKEEGYVIPVQKLIKEDDLTAAYLWLEDNAKAQKDVLERIMPEYIEKTRLLNKIFTNEQS